MFKRLDPVKTVPGSWLQRTSPAVAADGNRGFWRGETDVCTWYLNEPVIPELQNATVESCSIIFNLTCAHTLVHTIQLFLSTLCQTVAVSRLKILTRT